MSFHSHSQFEQIRGDLASLLISTAAQFARNVGLNEMDSAAVQRQMSVPIEDLAGELLMFGCDAWPESARAEAEVIHPFECVPSEGDPPAHGARPYLLALLAIAGTLPAAYLVSQLTGFANAALWPLSLLFVALVLGRAPALLACVAAAAAHNLFLVQPALTFTVPDSRELSLAAFYVALVLMTPWLASQAGRLRTWVL